jgi:BirA family biotin operon repressor/biotin-[acetyl-CoA-carboxylase] ligase
MNVCGSFCFFLPRNRRDIASLSLVMALSVVDLLELYGCKPVIKWPNDIWVAGAKIAGILTEVVPYGDLQCIVVGIGVNVNMGNEELAAVDQAATSLSLLYGRQLDPQLVTLQLAEIFRVYLERFIAEGFAPFFARYGLKLLHKKGDIIAFNRSGMAAEGVLQQINGDGSLEILTSEGLMITLRSGELL